MTKHIADNEANQSHSYRPLALNAPKQRQGGYFEQQALAFLQQQGLTLIAQNWQQPKIGELDLVMLECGRAWSTLIFIEVRQRVRSDFGDAALSITPTKQRKIIKTAHYFLQRNPEYATDACSFALLAYDTQYANELKADCQPDWIKGAFIASAW